MPTDYCLAACHGRICEGKDCILRIQLRPTIRSVEMTTLERPCWNDPALGDHVLLGPLGVAIDLFQRGYPFHHFVNAVHIERLHSLSHRLLADLNRGYVFENQLANLRVDEHQLENALSA